jgi:hypothetical protein
VLVLVSGHQVPVAVVAVSPRELTVAHARCLTGRCMRARHTAITEFLRDTGDLKLAQMLFVLFLRLRGKDSNLDYLIQSQASYH